MGRSPTSLLLSLRRSQSVATAQVFVFVEMRWPMRKLAASPGFASAVAEAMAGQARTSGVRNRRTADSATKPAAALCAMAGQANGPPGRSRQAGKGWSLGKVLPPRLLGVGQTRYYFTTERSKLDLPKLAAGAGIAPAFAPSKGGVLRIRRPGRRSAECRVQSAE